MKVTETRFKQYQKDLIAKMMEIGATDNDLALLHTQTITNAITRDRSPEDVAWAILQ